MTDVLLPTVLLVSILLVSILVLAVAIRNLWSSRRSEELGEDRYELLRDQQERLEFLREERQTLIGELERQFQDRQQLMGFLGKTPAQLVEALTKEREEHLKAQERIENLKQERLRLEQELHQLTENLEREHKDQSGTQQEVERLEQERQRLTEDLQKEREERLAAQQRAKQQQRERTRLEREFQSLKAQLDSHKRASTPDRVKGSEASQPRRRRRLVVVGLLFGGLLAWLISLMVALFLLPL